MWLGSKFSDTPMSITSTSRSSVNPINLCVWGDCNYSFGQWLPSGQLTRMGQLRLPNFENMGKPCWNFEKPLVQNPSSIPLVLYRKRPTHLGMGQNHSKPMTSIPFITTLRGINIMKHHETSWNIPHRFLQVAFDPADSGSGPLGGCQTESGEPSNGKSYWNGWFGGTPILGNLHFYSLMIQYFYSLMIQYFYSLWSNISIV